MNDTPFHQTRMGHTFFDATMPGLVREIARLNVNARLSVWCLQSQEARPTHGFRVEFRAMDLLDLLKRPEGKTLEFKRELASPDGVLRTLVAFANTAGGVLLIGVEDATRHVRGVSEPLDMEERLASLITDSIQPRLVPDLEILPWRRTQVVAVQVYPSGGRPHYLKREGPEAGVYVRVGSTNRRADRELIEELKRFARSEAYDEQAMPEVDSEALDFRAASESFAQVRSLKRRDLETLRLVSVHQGRRVPTIGGMLLFGKDTRAPLSRRLDPSRSVSGHGQGKYRGPDRDPRASAAGH